jgi:hypothetical protein
MTKVNTPNPRRGVSQGSSVFLAECSRWLGGVEGS